jgi:hypothetical protein
MGRVSTNPNIIKGITLNKNSSKLKEHLFFLVYSIIVYSAYELTV